MTVFYNFLIVLQVVTALIIIGLVLIQHGKGADMGATFGSGTSGSLFGASGSASFLSRSTSIAAIIFFGATLLITLLGNKHKTAENGVMDNLPAVSAAPKLPGNATAPADKSTVSSNSSVSHTLPTKPQSDQIPK